MPFMLKASGGREPAAGSIVDCERIVRWERALKGEKERSLLRLEMCEEEPDECTRASRSERERLDRYSGRSADEIEEERESSSLDESERSGISRLLRIGAMVVKPGRKSDLNRCCLSSSGPP
jgi:hypothetical protein